MSTPGPWKFLKNGMLVTSDETKIIGTFHADGTNSDDNRDLIAAAPELLKIAKQALALHPEWDAARAAIASANES